MKKKQILIWAIVVVILALLVFSQVRTWKRFDWHTFASKTREVSVPMIVGAILLIYLTYLLRALRWKILLRPVRRADARGLIGPTFIGFAGLALLGRPGELVRPYIIARKQRLSLSSQMGVWAVERIFDLGAYTVLAAIDIFLANGLPSRHVFNTAGYVLIALVVGLSLGAWCMRRYGSNLADGLERRFPHSAPKAVVHVAAKARAFGEGLNTIHDVGSFVQIALLSVAIWFSVTVAYFLVLHAYPSHYLQLLPYSHVMLLVGFSMIGGLVQLPAVGGGSQLATIAAMLHVFAIPKELAISCGIMLWLVTFVAVAPVGLLLAHREHVSIRKLSEESQEEEEKEEEAQVAHDVRARP